MKKRSMSRSQGELVVSPATPARSKAQPVSPKKVVSVMTAKPPRARPTAPVGAPKQKLPTPKK